MFIRKYWLPISVFIVAIVGVGLYYLQTRPPKDPITIIKPVETEQPTAKAPLKETPKPPPPGETAESGHWHGDQWYADPHETEVQPPLAVDREPVAPRGDGVAASAPAMHLTYHTELLKSDPVEALRQQGQERGHWSADYLPDFPPDDMEAMELAHAIYDYIYYGHTIPVSEHGESSEFQRAAAKMDRLLFSEVNERYPITSSDWEVRARHNDLKMLAWPVLPYESGRIDNYRDYTKPSLIVRSTTYPDLPELGERR